MAELLQATVDVEGVDAIAAKLNHAEQELQEFLALTEQAEELGEAVSPEAYVSFTRGKERRIAQLKAELAATIQDKHAAQIPLLPAELEERVEEVWHELPLEVRRRIVKICWEGIIVLPEQPGSRRDPSLRVTLVPRTQRPKSMSASL